MFVCVCVCLASDELPNESQVRLETFTAHNQTTKPTISLGLLPPQHIKRPSQVDAGN
jgi:hypothetical protein